MDLQCEIKKPSRYAFRPNMYDLQCKNCSIDFSTIPLLDKHYKEVCGFECSACKKCFGSEKNFNNHILKQVRYKKCPKHEEEYGEELEEKNTNTNVRCIEDECAAKKRSFSCLKMFRQHLAIAHGIEVPATKHEFSSNDEFLDWKNEIERMQGNETSYVKSRGTKPNGQEKKISQYYYCNRSGVFGDTGYGLKKLKKQGSLKLGFFCSSSIETVTKNGIIYVKFFMKHYGHETGISNRSPNSIPTDEKPYIAGKIIQNQLEEEILEENIKEEINVDTMASSQRDIILNLMDDIEIKVHDEYSSEVFETIIKQLKCVKSLLNTESLHTEYLEAFSNSERIVDVPVKKKILSQGSKRSQSEAFHCAQKKLKPLDSCND